jgi:hypothetical protein
VRWGAESGWRKLFVRKQLCCWCAKLLAGCDLEYVRDGASGECVMERLCTLRPEALRVATVGDLEEVVCP